MIHPIIVNDKDLDVFDWFEAPAETSAEPRHARDHDLLENGVDRLAPGEAFFRCDQTLAFDTPFELKGDGRKFVVIASENGRHVAKPY